MEETVRTLLQYKSKFEQLKQDRHSVANSYEVSLLYTIYENRYVVSVNFIVSYNGRVFI